MSGFWPLIKIELLGLFEFNKALKSKDKKDKRKLVGFAVLAIVLLWFGVLMSFTYSFMLGIMLRSTNDDIQKMPTLMFTICSIVVLLTAVRSVSGSVVGFKDYERLSALPIKPVVIVLAKFSFLYAIGLGYFVLFTVPSSIVYMFFISGGRLAFVLRYLPTLFFLPLLPLAVGISIGCIVSVISSRLKHRNLFGMILYFVVFGLYFFFVFSINNDEAMLGLLNVAYSAYPVNSLYVHAVCEGAPLAIVGFIALSVLPFAAVAVTVGAAYGKINSLLALKGRGKTYRMKGMNTRSELAALIGKEFRRYGSSATVIMNTSSGTIFSVLLCVVLVIANIDVNSMISSINMFDVRSLLDGMIPLASVFFVGTGTYTSASISLEGKQLWIIRSAPLNTLNIFFAKIIVNLAVSVPCGLIAGIALCIAFKASALSFVFTVLITLCYAVLSASLGLILNLKYPVFDWPNEAVAVKQGAAVLIQSLVGIFAVIPIAAIEGVFYFLNVYVGLFIILLAFIGGIIGLYFILKKWGTRRFNSL